MKLKKYKPFNLVDHIKRYFEIQAYQPIVQWCQKNIDFSEQISAQRNKLDFEQYPYQVPILKQWQNQKKQIKTIVVVAPEQTGKTNLFVDGLLWNMVFNPCQSLIVYPADDKAVQTNQTKILPLMKHIPVLKQELDKPKSYRGDCYKFSNLISYFQGAGSKIVSKSCKIVVGDEVQAWPAIGNIDSVSDLKKRTRSYNSSICFLISTPHYQNGDIWQAFLQGSRGYWYLRCKECGQLTMRSCDIHNLQFEADYDQKKRAGVVKPETIRLICPKCKHEHTEADKRWMNINGDFIHQIPERKETDPSFQIGALASQLPSLSWARIAKKQLEAGKTSDLKKKEDFANSIRGLPYIETKVEKVSTEQLRDHQWTVRQAPRRDQIEMVFMTADTQDDRSVIGVWAWSTNDNYYLLKTAQPTYLTLGIEERNKINSINKKQAIQTGGEYKPIETVEDILNAEYLVEDGIGIKPLFCLMDMRGHRMPDIQYFIKTHTNVLGWLGGKIDSKDHFKQSTNVYHAIDTNAKQWQREAIFYLYDQKKRDSQYLFFYPGIEERVIEQIAACKPDPNAKWGHMPINWTFGNRVHDYFDVTKMAFCARDYAMKRMQLKRFRYCKSPRLLKYREQQIKPKENKVARQDQLNGSWFEV